MLGNDYIRYDRRIGVLYEGKTLETENSYRGPSRGLPLIHVIKCWVDFFGSCWRGIFVPFDNFEDCVYCNHGRLFSIVFRQGFEEKFDDVRWSAMLPPSDSKSNTVLSCFSRIHRKTVSGFCSCRQPLEWRHPRLGAGQICDLMVQAIKNGGGHFMFGVEVEKILVKETKACSIIIDIGSVRREISRVGYVISSLPLAILKRCIAGKFTIGEARGMNSVSGRYTILVYLFLDEPPRFPHCWLNVPCPNLKAGRITNYAAFGGDMVPPGKTALCVEYFCNSHDEFVRQDNKYIIELTKTDCASTGIISYQRIIGCHILRLLGIYASSHPNKLDNYEKDFLYELKKIDNFFNVSRSGTDVASYAGLKASEAIFNGDRTEFDAIVNEFISTW